MPNVNIAEYGAILTGSIQTSGSLSASVGSGNTIAGSVQITRLLDDHRLLSNRDAANQHPISAISNLEIELDGKVEKESAMTNTEIEDILRRFA